MKRNSRPQCQSPASVIPALSRGAARRVDRAGCQRVNAPHHWPGFAFDISRNLGIWNLGCFLFELRRATTRTSVSAIWPVAIQFELASFDFPLFSPDYHQLVCLQLPSLCECVYVYAHSCPKFVLNETDGPASQCRTRLTTLLVLIETQL